MKRGRWVFVPNGCRVTIEPLPKWETLPASFYSLQKSAIAARLFFLPIPQLLKDYCVENDVLPPSSLRAAWKIEKWIYDHRQAARALPSSLGATTRQGVNQERRRFFRELARRTPKRTRQDSIRAKMMKSPE